MKRFTYIVCLATLAWTARTLAVPPSKQATLVYADGTRSCQGEWYFGDHGTREFWTGGDSCAATMEECLNAYVREPSGTYAVLGCSSDYELSRGRKAVYAR